MGNSCNSLCGNHLNRMKMNKQGIYTPEQVQHTVDEYWWDEYGYEIVADRQKAEKIARQAFEWLVWMN